MASTIRVNREWAAAALAKYGGVAPLAEKLNLDRSTVHRQVSRSAAAGEKFIAAVLTTFPITFDDAFDVIDEGDQR